MRTKMMHRYLICAFALISASIALAQAPHKGTPPKTFPSAEEAARALVAADEKNDNAAAIEILGSDAKTLIESGDEVQDNQRRQRFVEMAHESMRIDTDPAGVGRFLVYVGNEGWSLPIPIVKTSGGYRFDAASAKLEILARRIGRNELKTIQALRDLVDAQNVYAYSDLNHNQMKDYAQRFISTPGHHDGLYWEAKPGEAESPLGTIVTEAMAEGYPAPEEGKASPYHGYIFRILKAQGPDASGGAHEYILHGAMIGGFAFIAYPADYAVTGVKTFIVNHDGKVHEKDLGPRTTAIASAIKAYNPDKTWVLAPVESAEPEK